MIPKIIHYCWFSGDPYPEKVKKCIQSWKDNLPDYELRLWDMQCFDMNSIPFVKEAISVKKWAFAADYIRLYALYTEGGVYLDSDVWVNKSFGELLKYDFFTSVEYHPDCIRDNNTLNLLNDDGSSKEKGQRKPGIGLQAAVLGSVPDHPYVKSALKWYEKNHFVLPDGSLNNVFIAPDVLAMVAEDYGFKYKNKKQVLSNNMLILPSNIFAGNLNYDVNDDTVAMHLSLHSWNPPKRTPFYIRLINKAKKCLSIKLSKTNIAAGNGRNA